MDSRLRIGEQLTKKKNTPRRERVENNKSEGQAEMRARKENKRGSSRKAGRGKKAKEELTTTIGPTFQGFFFGFF